MIDENTQCTAFQGWRRIASGLLSDVALKAKAVLDQGDALAVTIFDDETSRPIEVDFRGTADDVRRRLKAKAADETVAVPEQPRGPGRPKLGVVAREVTLLPRHWDWLNAQPGGASVALRRLVEDARRAHEGRDRIRQAQDAANRFMMTMAGDLPGFEEAARALFAGDRARFDERIEAWPPDVRNYARELAAPAFAN
ncbi:DUF2239 family protein [Kaistia dalseonensis]|uniref:DUF2239 family protein n=1 Tax=Kaistia dalseonensis TaxID=410840 RepID=A0ABU0H958_9HYPH|nr:DUF2239 family protein [Kaistia dalseonensis]MCX5495934.1 DUF2239 family protein [Kaistia dalseonensis]MDQ0438537.1 hypothetical protein [Kaistia dalseonensis]